MASSPIYREIYTSQLDATEQRDGATPQAINPQAINNGVVTHG
jgi:hypothetical protein